MNKNKNFRFCSLIVCASLILSACNLQVTYPNTPPPFSATQPSASSANAGPTPLPTRQNFNPGELVDYVAQNGDTLPALAARFNTTVEEILQANAFIPRDATTMPPGMPMKIPIYYLALWASPYKIIPDDAFVDGPTAIGFNTASFIQEKSGWLKTYRVYAGGQWRSGAEMVDYVSLNYSINPKLLLALLEYQGGALTQSQPPVKKNLLGFKRQYWESPYLQLVIAANTLNNGYYGWRTGKLLQFDDTAKFLIRPDPWQNAGSVAMQYYFAQLYSGDTYARATGAEGFSQTYASLFGDPWSNYELIPGSLTQPDLILPFPSDQIWSYTGGPHTGWGTGSPLAAIDLAPPADGSGCFLADEKNFAVSMSDGLVVRSSIDGVAIDFDKDGDERTGWVFFYLHLAIEERILTGTEVHQGDKIGYPSCVGGHATGTHVHIARKYNGEWMTIDSALPFVLSGWTARLGSREYLGTLTKAGAVVRACDCGDAYTAISGSYP
ncbi:MAG: LysM peptidoglycan-binding domain-containing protein [Anaerolineales bacterium]|nr:LysM peptidoglycan-binding domain-containing protein [Anaerolineales bacterium]